MPACFKRRASVSKWLAFDGSWATISRKDRYGLLGSAKVAQDVRCFDSAATLVGCLCRGLEALERFLVAPQRPQRITKAHPGTDVSGLKLQHAPKAAFGLIKITQVAECMAQSDERRFVIRQAQGRS